jgi:hypothetical protein
VLPRGLFRSITAVIDRFHFLAKDFYFYFFTATVFAIHMASFFIYPRLTTESWMLNLFRCSKQWHCTFFNYLNIIY